jgi:hypothetical protein
MAFSDTLGGKRYYIPTHHVAEADLPDTPRKGGGSLVDGGCISRVSRTSEVDWRHSLNVFIFQA